MPHKISGSLTTAMNAVENNGFHNILKMHEAIYDHQNFKLKDNDSIASGNIVKIGQLGNDQLGNGQEPFISDALYPKSVVSPHGIFNMIILESEEFHSSSSSIYLENIDASVLLAPGIKSKIAQADADLVNGLTQNSGLNSPLGNNQRIDE